VNTISVGTGRDLSHKKDFLTARRTRFTMSRKQLMKIISEISRKIAVKYKPEKIILFGSCARGNFAPDSDIDILIIKNVKNKTFAERWQEVSRITRDLKRRIPLEPLVFTPSEIKQKLKDGDFFIKDIFKNGKVVYEK